MTLFSRYQKETDLEKAFRKAKRNELLYEGNHLENCQLVHAKKAIAWEGGMVPRNSLGYIRSQLNIKKISSGVTLAVPVADDDAFLWEERNFVLDLESPDPKIPEDLIYQAIKKHTLVGEDDWITHLGVSPLAEKIDLDKKQGTLTEESFYLLASDQGIDLSETFSNFALAQTKAIEKAEKEGGIFQVFALRRGSNGEPLFQAGFIKKRSHLVARFRLAREKIGDHAPLGWYFFLKDDNPRI